MQERQITGKQFRDAVGRSGMKAEQAYKFLGLTRSTYFAWRSGGVPEKDVANVAAKLRPWLQVEGQPAPPLSTYSSLDLVSELSRRLALLERLSNDQDSAGEQRAQDAGDSSEEDEDVAQGTAVITGRGPSPDLGGQHDGSAQNDEGDR